MKKSDRDHKSIARPANYVGFIFVAVLIGITIFAWRSLTPRMPGMPATGGIPGMNMNGNNSTSTNSDMSNMDMGGDMSNMDMSGSATGTPTGSIPSSKIKLAQLQGDLHALTIGVDDSLYYGQHAGVQISRDGGQTWSTPTGGGDAMGMGVNSGKVFLAGHDFFAVSPDAGQTWQKPGVGNLPGTDIHGFTVAGNGWLYANLAGGGLYRSTDGGKNWNFVTLATTRAYKIVAATGVPPVLYALTQDQGLIRSSNGGTVWNVIKVNGEPLTISIEASGAILISLPNRSILRSSDEGTTWIEQAAPANMVLLAVSPRESDEWYGISESGQVYSSQDAGKTWVGI